MRNEALPELEEIFPWFRHPIKKTKQKEPSTAIEQVQKYPFNCHLKTSPEEETEYQIEAQHLFPLFGKRGSFIATVRSADSNLK